MDTQHINRSSSLIAMFALIVGFASGIFSGCSISKLDREEREQLHRLQELAVMCDVLAERHIEVVDMCMEERLEAELQTVALQTCWSLHNRKNPLPHK